MPQHAGVELHRQASEDGANPPGALCPDVRWPLPRTIRTPILLRLLAKYEHYDRMALLSLECAAWGFFTVILESPVVRSSEIRPADLIARLDSGAFLLGLRTTTAHSRRSNVSSFCCAASPRTSAAYPLFLRCQ
jgi:hypothetical protein